MSADNIAPPVDTEVEEAAATPKSFPLNRIVAVAAPYIATLSGAIASWLLVHVHFLGLFHFQHDGLATGIAQGIVFLVTAIFSYASAHHWLTGWQKWEGGLQAIEQLKVAQAAPEPAADNVDGPLPVAETPVVPAPPEGLR